ncbi:DUF2523 family protein [Thermomonas sp.]|uniref:DUF2523 family protein n=1 Tax=Thermomonas sp. TaxID=1971895 RepID=UPI0035B20EC2
MAAFEHPLLQGLSGFVQWIAESKVKLFVGKILGALGLAFVADKFIYDPMIQQAQQYWSMVPAMAATWVHALGIDTAVSLVLSAYGLRNASRIFMRKAEQAGGVDQ